jgi:hypothetical protein
MNRLYIFEASLMLAGLLVIVSAASQSTPPQAGAAQGGSQSFCRFAHTPKSAQHAIYAPVCGPQRP